MGREIGYPAQHFSSDATLFFCCKNSSGQSPYPPMTARSKENEKEKFSIPNFPVGKPRQLARPLFDSRLDRNYFFFSSSFLSWTSRETGGRSIVLLRTFSNGESAPLQRELAPPSPPLERKNLALVVGGLQRTFSDSKH